MSPHSQGHAVGHALARNYGYRPDDVLYTCLPLFHGNALWYTCYAALWADAAVALAPRFSASRFWDDIRGTGATQFNTLGAMTNIIWKIPPGPQDHDHKLRLCMTVPVPKEIYGEMQQRYHLTITSVYAMTENFAVTLFTPDDPPSKAGSAGRTRGDALLRVEGDDGSVLGPREVGEICIQPTGPGLMMKGYYKMPEATAREFRDGWFHTGDRGYVDEDGYLFFVDRKKEAIRRRGENISAWEVEQVMLQHDGVESAAVIPVASEHGEDEVMAWVVARSGASLDPSELVAFCRPRLPYFAIPRYVEICDELPLTENGKIQKFVLRQRGVGPETWDREAAGIIITR
jgi:crotonobetaine/carnitine-CoA ligase